MTVDYLVHGTQDKAARFSSLEDMIRSCPDGQLDNLESLTAVFLRAVSQEPEKTASKVRFGKRERMGAAEPSVAEGRGRRREE